MFFLQPGVLQILILIGGIILAIMGLTFFALRRREEILEEYLRPEEKDIEDDFFRRRAEKKNADQLASEEQPSEFKATDEVQWGTGTEADKE